jgi:hypothetical protein
MVDGAEDRAPVNEAQPPVKEPTGHENFWSWLKEYSIRFIYSLIFFQWIAAAHVLYFVYHGHHCSGLIARYLFGVFTTTMTLGLNGLIAVYFPGPHETAIILNLSLYAGAIAEALFASICAWEPSSPQT